MSFIDLKFMVLNAENLFLLSDFPLNLKDLEKSEQEWQKLSSSIYPNKSIFKCRELARILKQENPDLLLLCEVGGVESLENFNHLFLNDQYSVALMEGNSDRNIDVGFLIRKGLPFFFDISSNRNRIINNVGNKFSRDVAELSLFTKNSKNPFFLILLTHLKSRLDREGTDPQGFERRKAELSALVDIYLEREALYQNQLPILVAGDLNGNASGWATDPEFAPIYQRTQLIEVCKHSGMDKKDAVTFFQVGRKTTEGRMLDYAFLSPRAASYLVKSSVEIVNYLTPKGLPADPPRTLEAKQLLPSDHYPLVFKLSQIPLAGTAL